MMKLSTFSLLSQSLIGNVIHPSDGVLTDIQYGSQSLIGNVIRVINHNNDEFIGKINRLNPS